MNLADLRARLDAVDRTSLASRPTPLLRMPRLQAALGPEIPELWVKLDEQTGFGLGGNKVRKLDRELAPSRLQGVTHLVTTGGPQSNHCRVTAAAAARLGLGCVLVINGAAPDPPTGNALLHRTFGARIHQVADRAAREPALQQVSAEIEAAGGRALVLPLGASTALGAIGFVEALVELHDQKGAAPDRSIHLFVSSSSGGTLAGLWAGLALLDRPDIDITAVSADTPAPQLRATAERLAAGALERLQFDAAQLAAVAHRIDVRDDQIGTGYGQPTEASEEAAELLATSEGVLVEPFYTAKAAAGMITAVRDGQFPAGDRVIFWHTGGHPALFR